MMWPSKIQGDAREPSAGSPPGFTLLELLVAIAILSMIVLAMAGVFHQSRLAWNIGMQKSAAFMTGRTLTGFIAFELSQAVADSTLRCDIKDGVSIEFFTLGEPSAAGKRAVKWVRYNWSGSGGGGVVSRSAADVGAYPPSAGGGTAVVLAKGVTKFEFTTPDGRNFTTNLPRWVDLTVEITQAQKGSKVAVWSCGPDKIDGTSDDIRSDE